jgi:tRNA(fMet)-specific endonuclease VapC
LKLLDTDTCIEILRGNEAVIDRRATQTTTVVATTWITAAELFYGAAKSKAPEHNRSLVTRFLETMLVLDLGPAAAQIFGESKALLERAGQRLADADLFIGAIAAANGATVVTGNTRHYERFPGIQLEDWIRG